MSNDMTSRAKAPPGGQVAPMGEWLRPEAELTALRWSARCNAIGVGYLGPSVKRYGPLPELAALVRSGLLRCEEGYPGIGRRNADALGYWITDAGQRALVPALGEPPK